MADLPVAASHFKYCFLRSFVESVLHTVEIWLQVTHSDNMGAFPPKLCLFLHETDFFERRAMKVSREK